MNRIENVEIEKYEVGHPRNDTGFPILRVCVTPSDGRAVEIGLPCGSLTAAGLASAFRAIARAIERWADDAGITKSDMEAA